MGGDFNVDDNAGLGFGLVIGAGAATGVGAAAVFFKQLVALASKKVLAAGIGISGGVMLYVSFVEIFGKSVEAFTEDGMSPEDAYLVATICFFSGCAVMKILSFIVHLLDHKAAGCSHPPPSLEAGGAEPLEAQAGAGASAAADPASSPDGVVPVVENEAPVETEKMKLQRMGLNTAVAIALHNFPEGLATFVATLADPTVGATLAFAIAIHNIPEGLCVALPVYYAKGNRFVAFMWGILSGVSEPIGALLGYIIVKASGDDMAQVIYGILFGLVAVMMVAIVLVELLPTAHRYDPEDSVVNNCVFLGMGIMAVSLVLFMY
jgi:ZIP family zinc transporter